MKCVKKYQEGGMMENRRYSRPERRIARNREDVGRILADLEGYDPESQQRRDMARKIAALGAVGAAAPAAITLPMVLNQARRDAMKGRNIGPVEDGYWGTSTKELSDLQKLLIQMFGVGGE